MIGFTSYEPSEVPEGTAVTILSSSRLGLQVCIPLHSIPDKAALSLLVEFAGDTPTSQVLWEALSWNDPFGEGKRTLRQLAYLVGTGTLMDMRRKVFMTRGEAAWGEEIKLIHLHG